MVSTITLHCLRFNEQFNCNLKATDPPTLPNSKAVYFRVMDLENQYGGIPTDQLWAKCCKLAKHALSIFFLLVNVNYSICTVDKEKESLLIFILLGAMCII